MAYHIQAFILTQPKQGAVEIDRFDLNASSMRSCLQLRDCFNSNAFRNLLDGYYSQDKVAIDPQTFLKAELKDGRVNNQEIDSDTYAALQLFIARLKSQSQVGPVETFVDRF